MNTRRRGERASETDGAASGEERRRGDEEESLSFYPALSRSSSSVSFDVGALDVRRFESAISRRTRKLRRSDRLGRGETRQFRPRGQTRLSFPFGLRDSAARSTRDGDLSRDWTCEMGISIRALMGVSRVGKLL